jgi:hypothetical protein
MQVYDTDLQKLYCWNETADMWDEVLMSSAFSPWDAGSGTVFLSNINDFVGIGTASPTARLDVRGNALFLSGGAGIPLGLSFGRTGEDAALGVAGGFTDFSNFANIGNTILRANTSDLILTARNGIGSILFGTGAADSEKMRLSNAGNLGIGINPTQRLDVNGASVFRGQVDMNTTNKIVNLANPTLAQDAATKAYVDAAASGTNFIQNQNATNQTADFRISGSGAIAGNLGVGLTGPSYPIQATSAASDRTVHATSGHATGVAVYGTHTGGSVGVGVFGTTSSGSAGSAGVYGNSTVGGIGVLAESGSTSSGYAFRSVSSGGKTSAYIGAQINNTATSSTNGVTKTALDIQSTGAWTGTGAANIGLNINTTGGTNNYAAILNGGFVGIGNSAPAQILDVTGTITASAGYRVNNALATAGTYLRGDGTNFVAGNIQASDIPAGSSHYIQNQNAANQTANFRISGTGEINGGTLALNNGTSNFLMYPNVGSGPPTTTIRSPGSRLVFWPSLSGANTDYAIGIQASSIWYGLPTADNSVQHIFYGGTTELMRIRGDGQVGIGTTAPVQKLEVQNGSILVSNNNSTAGRLILSEPSGSGSNFTAFRAQAQAADITYTLPPDDGNNGDVLTSNGIGGLTWQPPGAGSYILNQNAIEQVANFRISGTGEINGGSLNFNNPTSNWVQFPATAMNPPSFTTRSTGSRLLLWPSLDASNVDYAIGIQGGHVWYSSAQAVAAQGHIFYGGTTELMRVRGDGRVGIGIAAPTERLTVHNGNIILSNSGTAGQMRFAEPSGSGVNFTAFQAQAQAADIIYTLPASSTNGVLTNDGSGALTWDNGSGSFIQNQSGAVQTANFRVSGDGFVGNTLRVGTTVVGAGTGTLNVNGNYCFTNSTNRELYIDDNPSGVGRNLTVRAGNSTGVGAAGGELTLRGGNGTAGNADGGNIIIHGGSRAGTGNMGNVVLAHTGLIPRGMVGIGLTAPQHLLHLLNGNIALTNDNNTAQQIRFYEPNVSGFNYTAFRAGIQGTDVTYTLPTDAPSINGQALTSTTGGVMNWTTLPTGESTTASNGVNRSGVDIRLGGGLTANTTITQASNSFTIANDGTANTIINLSGTGDFDVQDNGISALFVQDNGNVGIGNAAPLTKLHVNGNASVTRLGINNGSTGTFVNAYSGLEISADNSGAGDYGDINLYTAYTGTGGAPVFQANRSLGSLASKLIVSGNTNLVGFVGRGYDGTNYLPAAQIFMSMDGTPGTNDMPGKITFSTTSDGASSSSERMRITNAGLVGIGGTPTQKFEVANGNVLLSSTTATPNELRLEEGTNTGGNHYTAFRAGDQAGNITYTLPIIDAVGVLTSDGGGNLSWGESVSGSGTTDRVARWVTASTLGTGAVRDNGTAVGVSAVPSANFSLAVGQNSSAQLASMRVEASTSGGGYNNNTALNAVAGGGAVSNVAGDFTATSTPGSTAHGLMVSVGGTGTNYAATFTGGNVGIGTVTPTQKLEVQDGIIYISNTTNNAGELRFQEPSGSGTNFTRIEAQAQAADILLTLPAAQGAANTFLRNDGSGGLSWVGITGESTTAGNGLTLVGNDVRLGGTLSLPTTINNATASNFIVDLTGTGDFEVRDAGTTFLYARDDGNMGIGTSAPASILELRRSNGGGVGPILTLTNPGAGGSQTAIDMNGYDPAGNPATARILSTDDGNFSSHLTFQTKTPGANTNALVERLRIHSNGNVSVGGQTLPSQKFEVHNGNVLLSNTGTAGQVRFAEPSGSGTNFTAFQAQTQAADILYTLPAVQGASNTFLRNDGSGGLSWVASSGDNLGNHRATAGLDMQENSIRLGGLSDVNHALRFSAPSATSPFNGVDVNGPVLHGYLGGVLGTKQAAIENIALYWNANGRVAIGGNTAPTHPLDVTGNTLLRGTAEILGGDLALTNATSNVIRFNTNGVGAPTFTTRSSGTKLVLYPSVSVSAVDYALGIEGNHMWYSVDQATSAKGHIFYAGNSELMRLRGDGRLGIGTNAPAERLSINGNISFSVGSNRTIRVEDQTTNIPGNSLTIKAGDAGGSSLAWAGGDVTISGGNAYNATVGGADGGDVILRSGGNLIDGNDDGGDIIFQIGGPNSTFAEKMRFVEAGYLGIGTNNPIYPLDIQTTPVFEGSGTAGAGRYFHSGSGINVPTGAGGVFISVRATGGFWSNAGGINGGFYVNSDERIKNIAGVSNSTEDLATLNKIEITNYSYKDTLGSGTKVVKGVIAQQVETVYPQAISRQTNVIPDIYALAITVKADSGARTLELTLDKTVDLKVGEKVRLITPANGEKMYEVVAVNGHTFTVSGWETHADQVFVYGKEVSDFRIVDYDRIFTLTVSGVQELSRKVQTLEHVNAGLIEENLQLKQQQVETNARLSQLETSLGQLYQLIQTKPTQGSDFSGRSTVSIHPTEGLSIQPNTKVGKQ